MDDIDDLFEELNSLRKKHKDIIKSSTKQLSDYVMNTDFASLYPSTMTMHFPNNLKHIVTRNQNYEFAAMLRDLEKDITIPITAYGQETTDWQRVNSLDPFKYYDRIERLIDKYSEDKIDGELRYNLKQLYNVVMRPVVRQEMISKILGENDGCSQI